MALTRDGPSGGTTGDDGKPSPTGGTKHSGAVGSEDRRSVSEDELFEMLANSRRRYILHTLMREDRPLEIGTLSTQIAAREDGLEPTEVTSKDRKRVYTALQQSHLPKMDEAGVVDFDSDRGTVSPTPALKDVEIYIDIVRGRERPWSDYYLGLAFLSALVLGGAELSVTPFTMLPSVAWSAFVVAALVFSAVAHRLYSRRNRLGVDNTLTEFDRLDEYERKRERERKRNP